MSPPHSRRRYYRHSGPRDNPAVRPPLFPPAKRLQTKHINVPWVETSLCSAPLPVSRFSADRRKSNLPGKGARQTWCNLPLINGWQENIHLRTSNVRKSFGCRLDSFYPKFSLLAPGIIGVSYLQVLLVVENCFTPIGWIFFKDPVITINTS